MVELGLLCFNIDARVNTNGECSIKISDKDYDTIMKLSSTQQRHHILGLMGMSEQTYNEKLAAIQPDKKGYVPTIGMPTFRDSAGIKCVGTRGK